MATATAADCHRRGSGWSSDSDKQPAGPAADDEQRRWPDVRFLNLYAVILAYTVTAMNLVGSLALLWATVVILGGFVTALTRKELWYLTSIAFIQAAGLFGMGTNAHYKFLLKSLLSAVLKPAAKFFRDTIFNNQILKPPTKTQVTLTILGSLGLVLNLLIASGPIVCFGLSLVRLRQQDYGSDDGDGSKANLKLALNLFYSLSLAQSAAYIWISVLQPIFSIYIVVVFILYHGFQSEVIVAYIQETFDRCMNNPVNISNWNMVTYGGGLLDSESPEDYVLGVRTINMLIEQEIPITRHLIRWPGHRIQRLIGVLGWRSSPDDRETREVATRIVAYLASDLILSQFPGALECISTLLDTSRNPDNSDLGIPTTMSKRQRRKGYSNETEWNGTNDELILQGLVIIENLTRNQHNCRLIYDAKALLSKITAPLRSDNLTEDIEVNAAWPKVVDASLRVVSRLMADPGDTGRDMRRDIADNSKAVQNLVAVLHLKGDSSVILNLQKQAIGVLGHLFSDDPQVRLWDQRDASIHSMVHLFLTDKWMDDYLEDRRAKIIQESKKQLDQKLLSIVEKIWPSILERNNKKRSGALMKQEEETASQLKIEAGKALAMLSVGSSSNCDVICGTSGDVIHCLTEMMDSTTVSIGCRINAAVVLRHLCTHRTLDDGSAKKNILQKVCTD